MQPSFLGRFGKLMLFILAILVGTASMIYTSQLVEKLSDEERRKIELWAEATKELENVALDGVVSLIAYKTIQENTTIPTILLNDQGEIISAMNLNPQHTNDMRYLHQQLQEMRTDRKPIIIEYSEGQRNYIYYKDSILLTQLFYYPFIQLAVIFLFIVAAFFAFRSSRRAEQNMLWVGMSKETAHQLGTPISSLLAWIELLKLKEEDQKFVTEVEHDVKRLEMITERFSKIGAKPDLTLTNINETLQNAVDYLKKRTSKRITYILPENVASPITVPLNTALFGWVIENLCKNAIDAMGGQGTIQMWVAQDDKQVVIDISDTGKGIPKSSFKKVFNAGYTTKKRGWGLGLSLVKRIIEFYHNGKIFVKHSELGKGTTFRIILKRRL